MPGRSLNLFLVCCLVCFIWACNPREEGCLDLEAKNFGINAEESCTGCCTYPELFWNMTYKWDTLTFGLNTLLPLGNGDSISFQHAVFLLSDVRFIESNGDTLHVLDELTLDCSEEEMDNEFEVKDDFALINRQGFNFPIGMRATSPALQAIRTSIGLKESLQCYDPAEVVSGHPLAVNGIYDQEAGRAALARFYYTFQGDTIPDSIHVHGPSVDLLFPVLKDLRLAANDTFRIEGNYQLLFEGIDRETPQEQIKGQIRENLAEFLRYRQ